MHYFSISCPQFVYRTSTHHYWIRFGAQYTFQGSVDFAFAFGMDNGLRCYYNGLLAASLTTEFAISRPAPITCPVVSF